MKRPNFFLLGAPKSGSTALYTYLYDHPQVFFPRLKEPRFFAADFGSFREITRLSDYEKLYAGVPAEARAIGDGSPWYLASEAAVPALRDYAPRAKAVVILRNPLEMLPSLHNQFLFSFKETEKDLRRAWQLQDERRAGRNLPPASPAPSLLQYGKLTRFGDQVERLYSLWPREQVHVILFDDFRENTREVYARVLDFLGLDDDGRRDFPVVNVAARHQNETIGWLVNSPASPLRRGIMRLRSWTGLKSTGRLAPLLKGNRARSGKAVLEASFRAELVDYYREDVAKLGTLLGRDLSHWLGRPDHGKAR